MSFHWSEMPTGSPLDESKTPILPDIPRPITRRVRRRVWNEGPVRFWMILSVLVGACVCFLTIQYISEGIDERRVIYNGIAATGQIIDINGDETPRRMIATHGTESDRIVHLRYRDTSGNEVDSTRELQTTRFEGKRPGQTVEIRFDPKDPKIWTDRLELQPWRTRFAMVWLLLPALVFPIVLMLVRRRQLLKIWRDGIETAAKVVEVRPSPIAPRSRVVRYTLGLEDDRRVFLTLFPTSAGQLQPGDELLMLTSPGNPARAIVAELYQDARDES
jgi:hypothetical protein